VLFRNDLTPEQMMAYLDRVRAALHQPVSIAEPDYIWLQYPELADHVDFITIHLFPFWNGVTGVQCRPKQRQGDAVGQALGAYQRSSTLPEQAHRGRRDRLAVQRRPPRARLSVDLQRSDLRPRMAERGQESKISTTTCSKPSTSRGRKTSAKAAPARTGACSTPIAS
jgi:hypothetical protein